MRILFSVAALLFSSGVVSAAPVDFARDVQPILNQSCVSCHGPAKAKGGIRLDSLDAVNKSGAVVVGNSAQSSLFLCLTGAGGTAQMPPKGRLTAPQMTIIKDWIDQGAKADPKVMAKPNPIPKINPPVNEVKLPERDKDQIEKQLELQKERAKMLPGRQKEQAEKQLERQKELLEKQRELLKKQRELRKG